MKKLAYLYVKIAGKPEVKKIRSEFFRDLDRRIDNINKTAIEIRGIQDVSK
jgi:hypothetical protein